MIETKWKFIEKRLKELNAPDNVINAATQIDNILEKIGLGHNTDAWIKDYENTINKYNLCNSNNCKIRFLHGFIYIIQYCTACNDVNEDCDRCKLSQPSGSHCTPISKYGENYFSTVSSWLYQ